tara:strand:+ start:2401 stop:2853 length:453 start_codon:yes stop_codon:yes gene_type:complete
MKKILFVIILSIFSNNVFGAELWQGLNSGATSQEIIKKFPSAKEDRYKRLIMKDYMVLGKNFTVEFRMDGDKLKVVRLDTKFTKYDHLYSKAFDALTLKYGEPSENVSTVLGNSANWHHDGVDITLVDNYSSSQLFIIYNTDLVDNANKL